jgi:hypothetical protein
MRLSPYASVPVLIEPHPRVHEEASPEIRTPSPVLDVLDAMDDQPCPRLADGKGFHCVAAACAAGELSPGSLLGWPDAEMLHRNFHATIPADEIPRAPPCRPEAAG